MPARPKPRKVPKLPHFKPGEITGATMRISSPQPAPRRPGMRTGANLSVSTSARRRVAQAKTVRGKRAKR